MIAVRISPPIPMAIVASEEYLQQRGTPSDPHDLRQHQCLNLRMPTSGAFYDWKLGRRKKMIQIKLEGQLVFNAQEPIRHAALQGIGIANLPLDQVRGDLEKGRLIRVLESWSQDLPPYHLYYPSRHHPTEAFRLSVDAVRYR